MANGGKGWMPSPTGFSSLSGMRRDFLQTKFLSVCSFMGNLSMKKIRLNPPFWECTGAGVAIVPH